MAMKAPEIILFGIGGALHRHLLAKAMEPFLNYTVCPNGTHSQFGISGFGMLSLSRITKMGFADYSSWEEGGKEYKREHIAKLCESGPRRSSLERNVEFSGLCTFPNDFALVTFNFHGKGQASSQEGGKRCNE